MSPEATALSERLPEVLRFICQLGITHATFDAMASAKIPQTASIQLRVSSSKQWLDKVLEDFDSFLLDHAANERKASATGINFVVQYPDRSHLIDVMIRLAREELLHFQQVCRIVAKRGLRLTADQKDPYIASILSEIRNGSDSRFRLLAFGIIEARGCERFTLIADALPQGELKTFYQKLCIAEARHHQVFIDLALKYFDVEVINNRLSSFLDFEAKLLVKIPPRAAMH